MHRTIGKKILFLHARNYGMTIVGNEVFYNIEYQLVKMIMNRNLHGNLECEAPAILVNDGCKKQGRGMLGLLLIAIFAFFLNEKVWAQTNYSGVYYIGTSGYNASTPNNNYYLCPTEGWIFYKPTNAWSDDGTTYPNPFLTTYRCKAHANDNPNPYDLSKAVWTIERAPAPNSDYYYIKQNLTGKYMVSNGQISGTNNANRMRVHIESVAPENLDDKELFSITPYESYLVISPKSSAGWNGNNKWYTVNGGNQDALGGSGSNGGPGTYTETGGILGLYTQSDANAKFYLEQATIDPPTITNNFDGTITIATETGAAIYYTTDGTTPTTSSYSGTGTTSLNYTLQNGVTVIKAIAKSSSDYFPTYVRTYRIPVCDRPVITVSNSMVATITCNTTGASIYYTIDGAPATTSSTQYGVPFNAEDVDVIRAIATSPGYLTSSEAFYYHLVEVSSSGEITNMNGNYILANGFNSSASIGTADNPFKGIIDGNYNAFALNGHALIGVAEDAVIKNIVVSSVTYTGSGNVGAIVNTAKGDTKIYNCGVQGGSVSGGTNTGGLVGLIEAGSSVRVVNCYNFADVTGGGTNTYAAGIVGKNEGTVSSDGTVGDVRIALCMMYGSVSGAANTNISPVYTGNHVNNVQKYTEYNFYLYSNERDANGNKIEKIPYTAYNDQHAIGEEEYLTRFPFHRHILNTHRELGAFFLFGSAGDNDVNSIPSYEISEIGHWALKPEAAYPIVEPWLTNKTNTTPTYEHNNLPNTTEDYKGRLLTEMGDNGYLNVSISIDGHSHSARLPITDMNTDLHDYTWGKVVLPFANEFEINSNYDRICTGWKITSVTKEGTSYTTYSATNYNFADRDNPQKDIYDGDNLFIFAQGGYYIVPYGVTAITIVANFANAIYLSDATYDVGYTTNYDGPTGLGGYVYAHSDGKFHGKTVYHNISDALGAAAETNTPHTQAIVLVGNYHFPTAGESANYLNTYYKRAFTLMSIDADNNQEPDYAFYSNSTINRPKVPPMRFDFVALVPLGMAAHVNGSRYYPGLPIWNPRGWFEMTETSLSWTNQFELGSAQFQLDPNSTNSTTAANAKKYNRLIINSGYFVQMVRASKTNNGGTYPNIGCDCNRLIYSQIGGNTYIKEYYPGSHSATPRTTALVPVNVTGGEIEQCFMTGYGCDTVTNTYGTAKGDNIYFWCAGGKIGKFLGAFMEPPIPANTGGKVDMTAKIDHALITEFYGGGTSPEARITGKIDVTINNSRVDRYCGGPEFGDMTSGETVITRADNTTFGYFYGAGFGGTGITYYTYEDFTQSINNPSNTVTTTSYPPNYFTRHYSPGLVTGIYAHGRLIEKNGGIGTCYKFEYIVHSFTRNTLVARFYTGFAKFDLATTGNVTNRLTNCTVLYDFYGGGCQGKVNGTVTSRLTDCTVNGSAYGAGYKATANEVEVYPTTPPSALSQFTMATGIFSEFHIPEPVIFQWKPGTAGTSDETNLELYTDKPMGELGDVTGEVTITLDGHTIVQGNVFGGGNESKSLNDATVTIKDTSEVMHNVYGGGNKAAVNQNTTVNLQGSAKVNGNVYGGGNEGAVGGNSSVNIEDPQP